jgi:hypothetical protein
VTAYSLPKIVFQISGVASVLAGILLIFGFVLHPAGEDPTFGTDPLWLPAHGLSWVALTIALLGWIGLYIIQASRAGGFGTIAFVVIIFGTSLASWIFSSGVTYVPVIAAQSPELFPQIENQTILLGIVSVLSWILGNVLFGVSVIRSRVFPEWAGVLLIIGSLVIPVAYLTGLSVRVVAIGGLLVGVSQIWLGYDLFRTLRTSTSSA